MNQHCISVIIPVYNVCNYLEKCVASVINQTHKELEIILIDDGSTDGSGELCDKLMDLDSRIIVVHQDNQGLSVARNTGLEIAKGDWIAFLDSDDWIEPDMYEVLLELAYEQSADIVSCSTHRCESEATPIPELDNSILVLKDGQIVEGLISNEILRFEVWNKLWKRSLIGDVRFIPKQVSEDVHFDRILFDKANKIVHKNCVLHNYRVNRPGNTNSSFRMNRLCIFDEFSQWYESLRNEGKNEQAMMIATVAAQFAIHIYEEAIEKKQSTSVKNELTSYFRLNHERAKGFKYYFGYYKAKAWMMSISPALYSFIWLIRTIGSAY